MTVATSVERLMLDLINDERRQAGVDPLELERQLNTSAENHSEWMLDRNVFSHTGQGGSSAGDRMADAGFDFSGSWSWGENVAWQSERGASGIADDVRNLHESLMNSPGHRANILSANFDYIGIGVEVGNFSGYDAVMVTQNFAKTGAPVQIDGGGAAPKPQVLASDDQGGNSAPEVEMGDLFVARVRGAWQAKVEKALDVVDADGDDIVSFEFRDTEGRDSFRLKGTGILDAENGVVVAAEDLDQLVVIPDRSPGTQTLSVRASDGEDWGEWEDFRLTTLSPEDWSALG